MKSLLVPAKNIIRQFPFIHPRGISYSAKSWIDENNASLDWFSRKNSDWYLKIYDQTITSYPRPQSLYSNVSSHFQQNLIKKSPDAYLYYFKGAYVFSNYGTVISRDNKVFADFCHYFNTKSIRKGVVYQPFKSFKLNIKKIPGNTAVLAAPESENYYHWVMDSLPRLGLLEKFIDSMEYFVVPKNLSSFHFDSLSHWGISEDRLIRIAETDKVFFENLFVPSLPGSEGNSPQWAIRYLRQQFIQKESLTTSGLIYLSRRSAKQRHIINEDEVICNLKNRGFTVYEMGDYTFKEQISLIRQAKLVVASHGAALTNLVFADKCQLLEIFSPDYIRPDCYFTLANQVGIDYWYLMGEEICNRKRGSLGKWV